MRTYLRLLLCLVLVQFAVAVQGARADLIDTFDGYATGDLPLTPSSSWNTWMGSSTNATVVSGGLSSPNALQLGTDYPDIVGYTDDVFSGTGFATFSLDFYVSSSNDNMALSIVLGSGNPTTGSINYGSGGTIATLVLGYGDTSSSVGVNLWGTNFGSFPSLTTTTPDAWHNLSLTADQTGSFDVSLDGTLVADDVAYSVLTNSYGFNAVEIYSAQIPSTQAGTGTYLIDNVSLTGSSASVPEPSTILLLAAGLCGFGLLRKRRRD